MDTVFIERCEPVYGEQSLAACRRLLARAGFSVRGKRVLVKPNLVTGGPGAGGTTTDVTVVRAVLERLEGCDVTVGNDFPNILEREDYRKLAAEFGAELAAFDLLEGKDILWVDVPKSFVFKKIPFARRAVEADVVVSVGKLKIHSLAQVTLSLKNMFGCVPKRRNRIRIHPFIQKALADIVQCRMPDFAVIDGIVGNQRDEVMSNPVPHGVVFCGKPMAVDAVGAQLMGLQPVEHLHHIYRHFGFDWRQVRTDGPGLRELAKPYETSRPLRTAGRYLAEKAVSYVLNRM